MNKTNIASHLTRKLMVPGTINLFLDEEHASCLIDGGGRFFENGTPGGESTYPHTLITYRIPLNVSG